MKELSLNILDIVENSVKAGADLITIELNEDRDKLSFSVTDNGCGMREEVLKGVMDPFYTTRTTRKVGLGIPLLKMAAEQTGGHIRISSRHVDESPLEHGTYIYAEFHKQHIDFTPLGDIISTVTTLIQGSPEIDFVFEHRAEDFCVTLDTRQLREILGAEIPLNSPEILRWTQQYLDEQYKNNIN